MPHHDNGGRSLALDRSIVGDLFFYLLIALAGFSPPLVEFGGDFVTVFDVYLLAYIVTKLVTSGFGFDRRHWSMLLVVFGAYLVYLTTGALRVFTPYSLLLLVKHFEHVGFLLVLLDRMSRTPTLRRDLTIVLAILVVVVGYQLLYYYEVLPGIGRTYRLGLPFMQGVSSNPSGFFLGATLIVLVHVGFPNRMLRTVSIPLAVLAIWALALTLSRTNTLAFLVVVALSIVVWIWRTRYRWPLLIGFLVLGAIVYFVVIPAIPPQGPLSRVIRILQDPAQILRENSFRVRRDELWVKGFETWLRNGWTFLFGAGLGVHERIDGTLPRLLGAQGLVGLVLFVYVWFAHHLWRERSPAVALLLVFVLINGINAETLVVSYRSVQLYLVLLMVAVYGTRLLRDEPSRRDSALDTGQSPIAGTAAIVRRRWPAVAAPVAIALIPALLATPATSTPLSATAARIAVFLVSGLVAGVIIALVIDYLARSRKSEDS